MITSGNADWGIAVMRILHHGLAVLDQLRLFMTVVEEGSLRRAAERAHISQSAVTRQMQRGKIAASVRALVDSVSAKSGE
jgi:hypothetical protein